MSASQQFLFGEQCLDLRVAKVMAVLNVTPDSFSDGGKFNSIDAALFQSEKMIRDGAAIIDIGGESTRPGAQPISLQEEMDRVLPIIEALKKSLDPLISLDSSSPELMLAAANLGVNLINDVRALSREGAIEAAVESGLPICLMHMKGAPDSMQNAPSYDSVLDEVSAFLESRISACVSAGIARQKIIIDPGFGFGKSASHNLSLLNRIDEFVAFDAPILVGLSRKSIIETVTGRAVDERLAGSVALATIAVQNIYKNGGTAIVRAHDVAQTVDALALVAAVLGETING